MYVHISIISTPTKSTAGPTCPLPELQKDFKSTRLLNLLHISTHYASFAAGSLSTERSQQLHIMLIYLFISSSHHLGTFRGPCRREQVSVVRKDSQTHIVTTAKKRKVLTCSHAQSFRYYSPDLVRFVKKIPGYSLGVVYASVFFISFIQSVEETRKQVFFPSLSFNTDVNGPGRVAPPAFLLSIAATKRTLRFHLSN